MCGVFLDALILQHFVFNLETLLDTFAENFYCAIDNAESSVQTRIDTGKPCSWISDGRRDCEIVDKRSY